MSIFNMIYGRDDKLCPWIYHNSNLWLISLSSDWETWITIADKNLGATTIYNDGDTLSEANSGKYYQWGNNYGFPFSWSVTTSSTQVNAQNYWPWNYYNSSTFITWVAWDSSNNANLWWWTTWTVEAMQWPCPNGFHIPSSNELSQLLSILTSLGLPSNYSTIKTYLKMPPTWWRDIDGNTSLQNSRWFYWASTIYDNNQASLLVSTWWSLRVEYNAKWLWVCVRPFKNVAVQPSWTKLY